MNTLINLSSTNSDQGMQIKVVMVEEKGVKRHARRESLSTHQVLINFLVVREVTKKSLFN